MINVNRFFQPSPKRKMRPPGPMLQPPCASSSPVNIIPCRVEPAGDLSVAATEFHAMLNALGLTQHRIAKLLNVTPRTIRRWQHGDRRIPRGVGIVLRLLAAGAITIAQVEEAAIPARTNGSAPKESHPLLAAPPEQSALACTFTTAEKVCALPANACCWPYGDPRRPDFYFCGAPVAEGPYCKHHRAMAYLAPRPGRAHGRQPAHGRPSPPPGSRAALLGHAQLPA